MQWLQNTVASGATSAECTLFPAALAGQTRMPHTETAAQPTGVPQKDTLLTSPERTHCLSMLQQLGKHLAHSLSTSDSSTVQRMSCFEK